MMPFLSNNTNIQAYNNNNLGKLLSIHHHTNIMVPVRYGCVFVRKPNITKKGLSFLDKT